MKLAPNTQRRVLVSARDVEKFNRSWPCSDIPERTCFFEYDRNGDLVDMSDHLRRVDNGSALNALSLDAQKLISIPTL